MSTPPQLPFYKTDLFFILLTALCFTIAIIGVFLTSDKDISALVPYLACFLPGVFGLFRLTRDTKGALKEQNRHLKTIEEVSIDSKEQNVSLAGELEKLNCQLEILQTDNLQLKVIVAEQTKKLDQQSKLIETLTKENADFKITISSLIRELKYTQGA